MKVALYMISNFVLADRVQSMAGMSISVGAEIQKTGKNCLKRKLKIKLNTIFKVEVQWRAKSS